MKVPKQLACFLAVAAAASLRAEEKDERTARALQDNSFFIEESYNQEPGVVQHIWNATLGVTRRGGAGEKRWDLTFIQEWPIGSMTHQFSYTVPASFIDAGGQSANGLGDVLINYRLQVLTETAVRPAFAPRFSLVLPTGDESRDLGNGTVGFQTNLPVSKIVSDRWTLHGNAGLTFLPEAEGANLLNYNLGGSVVFAANKRVNLLLEGVAYFTEEGDGNGGTRRECSALLSPGVRWAFNLKNGTQVVAGLGAPIGVTAAAPDYGAVIYFSIEHSFKRR